MVTKESIRALLETNDKAVERAIIVLFERQTNDEQVQSVTRHDNQRGFSAAHASKGSYYARWIKSGRRLTGYHLQNARRITQHYTHQLLLAAQEKGSRANLGAQAPVQMTLEDATRAVMNRAMLARRAPEGAGGYARREEENIKAGKCPDGCCGGEEEQGLCNCLDCYVKDGFCLTCDRPVRGAKSRRMR
jgi:hypothetical protein